MQWRHATPLLCLLAGLVGGWLGAQRPPDLSAQDRPPLAGAAGELAAAPLLPDEQVNIRVYAQANRSVVHITTRVGGNPLYGESQGEGTGSGSVLDRNGHVLTNYHVIEGSQDIHVTLFNGDELPAQLVGHDSVNDIAVLRIQADPALLHPVRPGVSSTLQVGQKVLAIGNPLGFDRTLTVGVISSLNRQIPSRSYRTMKSIIQLDAALNQGNSGGPLFDSSGRMIGMNTAIASLSGDSAGLGFAIPIDTIQRVVPQLIETGRVIRPDVGITAVAPRANGLAVAVTAPGGPAQRAGLRGYRVTEREVQRGPFIVRQQVIDKDHADVITAVDGRRVATIDQFLTEIEQHKPGDTVKLHVLRAGQLVVVPVVLGEAEQ